MWASKSSPFTNEKPFETIISKIWKEETLIKSLSVLHHPLVALLDTSIVHPEGKLTFKRVLPHIWIDYVTRAMPSEQVCIFKNMKWLLQKRKTIIHSPQKNNQKVDSQLNGGCFCDARSIALHCQHFQTGNFLLWASLRSKCKFQSNFPCFCINLSLHTNKAFNKNTLTWNILEP
jgi:hypothetical protein